MSKEQWQAASINLSPETETGKEKQGELWATLSIISLLNTYNTYMFKKFENDKSMSWQRETRRTVGNAKYYFTSKYI